VGKRGRRKRAPTPRAIAQPTTPTTRTVHGEFVEVDDTRTYNASGAFTRSVVGLAVGEAPFATVLVDLTGKWNHGAADELSLIMTPDLAREWAATLAEAATAADADLAAYLAGFRPDDHATPR
jgi:hypothetical protein